MSEERLAVDRSVWGGVGVVRERWVGVVGCGEARGGRGCAEGMCGEQCGGVACV